MSLHKKGIDPRELVPVLALVYGRMSKLVGSVCVCFLVSLKTETEELLRRQDTSWSRRNSHGCLLLGLQIVSFQSKVLQWANPTRLCSSCLMD